MSNSNSNNSTLQSAIDSVSGYAQSALGSLTGSNADKVSCPVQSDLSSLH